MWMIETVRIVESDQVTDRDKEVEYRRSGVKCQEPNERRERRDEKTKNGQKRCFDPFNSTPDGNRTHISRTGICHSIH